jgi:ABC-2 type transport system permease protein
MSLRRIGILLYKEIIQGPQSFIFIFGLFMPIILTLVLSLVFGTYFSGLARVGLVDQGDSDVTGILSANAGLTLQKYEAPAQLEDAASRGAIDLGMVLPANFDSQLRSGDQAQVTVFIWGESLMEHRITLGTAILQSMRQVAGQEPPVEIVERIVGDTAAVPWQERVLPFIVLISIMMAGLMVPATSIVTEKTKRTLTALAVSPATLLDIFAAKGILGMLMSMFGGIMILILNRAFSGQTLLLLFVLLMGATLSALSGVLLGAAVKDINTLFATMKGLGIFLYGPGIVQMFPEIPQWIGRLFPTYYILQPVLDVTQNNASLRDISLDLAILAGLILLLTSIVVVLAQRTREAEAAA